PVPLPVAGDRGCHPPTVPCRMCRRHPGGRLVVSGPGVERPVDVAATARVPAQHAEPLRTRWTTPAVISLGGVLGALACHGLEVAFPHPPGGFPWATFATNVTGCLLIGVLMAVITEFWAAP